MLQDKVVNEVQKWRDVKSVDTYSKLWWISLYRYVHQCDCNQNSNKIDRVLTNWFQKQAKQMTKAAIFFLKSELKKLVASW